MAFAEDRLDLGQVAKADAGKGPLQVAGGVGREHERPLERYRLDFGLDDHPSCLASIQAALADAREDWTARGELAWNVFMHNTITPDGHLVAEEPTHGAGAHLELEALDDLAVVASSCPQDLTPCNAWTITPVALRMFTRA